MLDKKRFTQFDNVMLELFDFPDAPFNDFWSKRVLVRYLSRLQIEGVEMLFVDYNILAKTASFSISVYVNDCRYRVNGQVSDFHLSLKIFKADFKNGYYEYQPNLYEDEFKFKYFKH